MKTTLQTALGALTFAAALVAGAAAQTAPDGPPLPRVEHAGGIAYVNGGAGEEARAAIERMRPDFALRNVFSGQGGQYVVADRVTVRGATGEPLEIRNAGPILMMSLPPGSYTLEADVGGQVQRKTVQIGSAPQQLSWRWPGG
ncbi:hypothetical protein [Methylibium sp.]|uniref:hypothetical protein n=1 Tax=Methylibium sp. TaxID=2067992 RepID=UPI003D10707D